MTASPAVPARLLEDALHSAYAAARPLSDGANAAYIPALSAVPWELFGVAVCTAQGQVLEVGDTGHVFAVESVAKVLSLALVMETLGAGALHEKVGSGATGLPFNSVLALELHGGRPLSPLVNAGAIATAGLLPGDTPEARWEALQAFNARFAGRPLPLLEDVYRSETATNSHNRGISFLLHGYGQLHGDPEAACDLYTRQCSVGVSTRNLAVIAGTLAAGGVNPVTGERVCARENVPRILAEMTMEGLYDASGDWAYHVGLPAKSGVGGGVLAVAPGVLGVAAFSPRLDARGNSVRGLHAVAGVAQRLGLNVWA